MTPNSTYLGLITITSGLISLITKLGSLYVQSTLCIHIESLLLSNKEVCNSLQVKQSVRSRAQSYKDHSYDELYKIKQANGCSCNIVFC